MLLLELALPFLVLLLLLRHLALALFMGMVYPLGHGVLNALNRRSGAGLGGGLLTHRDPFVVADGVELAGFEGRIAEYLLFIQRVSTILRLRRLDFRIDHGAL